MAAEYAHPIEGALNYMASGVGFRILSSFKPVHMISILIWVIYRVIETSDGHSGYDWRWSPSRLR